MSRSEEAIRRSVELASASKSDTVRLLAADALDLLAERDRLRVDYEQLRDARMWDGYQATAVEVERDRLRAQVAQLETELDDEIANRDAAEHAADTLAYTIGTVAQIGEHSSLNDPWARAADLAGDLVAHVARVQALCDEWDRVAEVLDALGRADGGGVLIEAALALRAAVAAPPAPTDPTEPTAATPKETQQ